MLGVALGSIAVGIFDLKHYVHLQLVPHISKYHQVSSSAAHHFASHTDYSDTVLEAILASPRLRQLQ